MIVIMKSGSNDVDVQHVLAFLDNHGLSGHLSQGVERTVIGVLGAVGPSGAPGSIGGINPSIGEALEGLNMVESVVRVSKPYKLASREFHPEDTVVHIPVACVEWWSRGYRWQRNRHDGRPMYSRDRETVDDDG